MSKIGDLFVRLGLKKDEFSKGMKEAKRESSSFVDAIKSIGSKGKLALAAVTAAVMGTIAAIKNLAKQNQLLDDAWNRMAAGMAASWDSFKTAVANMDFSHLLSDMREANRLARDLYDAQDALGEISTSYNISLSKQLPTINELKVKLRDMNLSEQERIKAGEQLKKIYEDLEKNPTRGLENVSDKTLDRMAQKLGYNLKGAADSALKGTRQQVEQFFIWLGTEAGESWNEAYAAAAKDPAKLLETTIKAQNAGLSDATRAMLYNYQRNVGDKDREEMEKAVTAYYQQQAKYSEETMRIQTQINSIKAQQANANANSGGQKEEVDRQKEQAEKILQRAQDAAKSEIQLLSEKYHTEKALLEQYGLDTTALYDEFTKNVKKILDVNLPDKIVEINFEVEDIDMSSVDEAIDAELDKILEDIERAKALVEEFKDAVIGGFSDAVQEMANQFMGLEDLNAGRVVQALLTPLADMAIKEGEILMAEGVGVEACKEALESLNGYAALAAGAALVMIGSAAKSGLQALAKSAGTGSGVHSTNTYTGGYGVTPQTMNTNQMELSGTVTVKGQDLQIALDNYNRSKNR